MTYLNAFLCGGLLCAVGQILIDRTQLTPARILTGYVVAGVLLQAVGLYQPLVDWGGAGATVPLTGFGYCLAKGVAKAVAEKGLLGALTGGLTATAGGIAAAVIFGVLAALAVGLLIGLNSLPTLGPAIVLLVLVALVMFNIPTLVYFLIYRYQKRRRERENLDRMKIDDLE